MHHTQIAQRVFNTPLMVDPAKALAFLTGLGPRITGREVSIEGVEIATEDRDAVKLPARASLFGDDLTNRQARNGGQPFAVVDGIAVIEIAGTLVHRGAWIGQSSGLTSYEGIAAQLQAAIADPAIRGIALDIDSFGGEVAGAFDLADRIRAARQVKPVQAFVADHALSAAYALASQADRIILPRTGAVGSIGVVAMQSDMSGALDQKGIAVTLIHAGARKVDANPYQPLPEAVRDRIAGELEDLRQLFAETVAEGRGRRLDTLRALGTEAAVFRGEAAVFAGLADEVADPVTAFRAFAAAPPRHNPTQRKGPEDDHRPRRSCAACGRTCCQHPAGTGPDRGNRAAANHGGHDVARGDPRRGGRGRTGLRASCSPRHPDRCRGCGRQGRETRSAARQGSGRSCRPQ